jgi:hypothetical protein
MEQPGSSRDPPERVESGPVVTQLFAGLIVVCHMAAEVLACSGRVSGGLGWGPSCLHLPIGVVPDAL